jgi:predicted amidohydrolase YtcJ
MKKYTNGKFYTMKKPNDFVKEIITDQGIITHMGNDLSHIEVDEILDLNGAFVYPGFVDAHLHVLGYGQKLSVPSLKDVKDPKIAIELIKNAYQNQTLLMEDHAPIGVTHHDLDLISKEHFIVLRHQDYHSVTVNSKVIDYFKVEHQQGLVLEGEAFKITSYFGKFDNQYLENILKTSLRSLWSYGLTGGHSDDLFYFNGFHDTFNVIKKTVDYMPFRLQLLVHHGVLDDYIQSKLPFLDVNSFIQFGPVKMFYDGTMGSKTAYLSSPYKGTDYFGQKAISPNHFLETVQKCRHYELPVAIHVIGDQAVRDVAEMLYENPVKKGLSDRLIHTPFFSHETLELMKKLPLFFDVQPQFLSSDTPWSLDLFTELPTYQFPWKTMIDNGLNVAFSSDAPVEIPNPFLAIYDAIERRSKTTNEKHQEKESVSMFEAIQAYTTTPNTFTYHQNRGYIDVGYIADFTVLKKDLFTMDSETLKTDLVYLTIIDDKIVYQAIK